MNRKELYVEIKKLNLQDKVKELFGENYTRVKNEDLANIIASVKKVVPKKETKNNTKVKTVSKVDKLINLLYVKHILLKSEVESINS